MMVEPGRKVLVKYTGTGCCPSAYGRAVAGLRQNKKQLPNVFKTDKPTRALAVLFYKHVWESARWDPAFAAATLELTSDLQVFRKWGKIFTCLCPALARTVFLQGIFVFSVLIEF